MRGRREDKECCGTCRWHRCEEIRLDVGVAYEWYCGNHTSEMYQEYTEYEDCCDDWED